MNDELKALTDTSHPNIVRVFELLHDDRNYYMISEYCKHKDLFEYMKQNQFTEKDAKKIIYQLFYVLSYIHNLKMVHRDIKPANILIANKDDLTIKVTDFGFATYFDE